MFDGLPIEDEQLRRRPTCSQHLLRWVRDDMRKPEDRYASEYVLL